MALHEDIISTGQGVSQGHEQERRRGRLTWPRLCVTLLPSRDSVNSLPFSFVTGYLRKAKMYGIVCQRSCFYGTISSPSPLRPCPYLHDRPSQSYFATCLHSFSKRYFFTSFFSNHHPSYNFPRLLPRASAHTILFCLSSSSAFWKGSRRGDDKGFSR